MNKQELLKMQIKEQIEKQWATRDELWSIIDKNKHVERKCMAEYVVAAALYIFLIVWCLL